MIEIKYDRSDLKININGHAGYAKAGQDIVCAGVSALFFAACAAMRQRGYKYFADLDEPDGYAMLCAYPTEENRQSCEVIFDTVAAGFELIAQQYPNNVHMTKEEK